LWWRRGLRLYSFFNVVNFVVDFEFNDSGYSAACCE
jgi:hypothetical protein